MSRSSRKRKLFSRYVPTLFGLILAGVVMAGIWWSLQLPDVSRLASVNPPHTALMSYREQNGTHGHPLWVPLTQIAPELRQAVIVAEDANFYRHHGVDWEAVWDAFERNVEEGRLYRGGSTITQQLAKNLYLDPSKTVSRKITEMAIALRMEHALSKSRILELYLNVVEWGHGIYGAESAARHYFGASASDLTLEEAAWLAAILPSPLRYEERTDSLYIQKRAERIKWLVERRLAAGKNSVVF